MCECVNSTKIKKNCWCPFTICCCCHSPQQRLVSAKQDCHPPNEVLRMSIKVSCVAITIALALAIVGFQIFILFFYFFFGFSIFHWYFTAACSQCLPLLLVEPPRWLYCCAAWTLVIRHRKGSPSISFFMHVLRFCTVLVVIHAASAVAATRALALYLFLNLHLPLTIFVILSLVVGCFFSSSCCLFCIVLPIPFIAFVLN